MEKNGNVTSKKKLVIVLIIILGVLLLMYGLTLIIPNLFAQSAPENTKEIIADFSFFPADYDSDIFEDEDYLSLISDGIVEYDDDINYITVVDKDTAASKGKPVKLLVDMIYSIINGDAEEYNSYFSQLYYETNTPKEAFTMQKIYDARLTYFSTESVTKDKVTFTEYTYKLKYRIYENNGTFRKDIGDGYRIQYITVSDREGALKIDSILNPIYK